MSEIIPAQHHRQFILLEGPLESCLQHFFSLSDTLSKRLLVASDTQIFTNAQNYITTGSSGFQSIDAGKLKKQLGQNNEAVFFDIEQGISANAISLIAGTIKGGGLFVLSLRQLSQWLTQVDQEQARFLPWPMTHADSQPYFKQYFLNKLHASHCQFIQLNAQSTKPQALNSICQESTQVKPNPEQGELIEDCYQFAIKAQNARLKAQTFYSSRLIIAHRGRGKSTALGMLLAQIAQAVEPIQVAITGPNKAALAQLESSYASTLNKDNSPASLFYSPDNLIHQPKILDLLIIDEAAALPLPMLMALFKRYQHVIFSSTDHGYEGAGKGFGIKFSHNLKQLSQDFHYCRLDEPVRWLKGDPLEAFIDELLLLDSKPPAAIKAHALKHKVPVGQAKVCTLGFGDWHTRPEELQQCFNLLVSAHYQTSADDIRWILDDPSITTWLLKHQDNIISTAIITAEGKLDPGLAQEVSQGTRRPRGHLLPQSLLAHEGHLDAGTFCYWRISRIACQHEWQHLGYGSRLIEAISEAGRQANIDFLSTSFAATEEVLTFWQKNGFICVRLGTSRDQASGCYSVMMLKPLSTTAFHKAQNYHTHYLANVVINLARDYSEIAPGLKRLLLLSSSKVEEETSQQQTQNNSTLFKAIEQEKDKQDLHLFARHHRPYDTIRAQLYRCFIAKQAELEKHKQEMGVKLLSAAILTPLKEADFSEFQLHTKKAIDKALRQAVAQYLI